MYLALFLAAVLYLYVTREEKNILFKYSVLGIIIVFLPLTGWMLEKYFQGFYRQETWQWMLPVIGVIAYALVDIYGKQWEKWKRYLLIPIACVIFVLCGFFAQSYLPKEEQSRAQEIEEIYDLILSDGGEREVSIVAPKRIMEGARAYDGRLLTVYGRDIWERDLDYAFYGNYEEWAYGLSEHMDASFEENEEVILTELSQSGATHVIFDKENLTFGEDMQYPVTIKNGDMELARIEETRHYVVYARTE